LKNNRLAATLAQRQLEGMTFTAMLALLLAALLGTGAGVLNTISGFGGGLLLTLVLATLLGPTSALVVAAPALAVWHLHRALGYREHINRAVALPFIVAAVPSAVIGSLLAASVPEWMIALALLVSTCMGVAQAFKWIPTELGARALMPGAGAIGFLAGSCGGGGPLLPPTLMSAGLSGRSFVATAAVSTLAIQLVRVGTYASTGMLTRELVPRMIAVALGLIVGNALGRRVARHVDDADMELCTRITLAVAIVLGVWGLFA
jgi:uncharacterized membrane protein YfcA